MDLSSSLVKRADTNQIHEKMENYNYDKSYELEFTMGVHMRILTSLGRSGKRCRLKSKGFIEGNWMKGRKKHYRKGNTNKAPVIEDKYQYKILKKKANMAEMQKTQNVEGDETRMMGIDQALCISSFLKYCNILQIDLLS